MNASTFDTLAAADRLRNAGFDDAQTRVIVDIHRDAGEGFATKASLAALRASTFPDCPSPR